MNRYFVSLFDLLIAFALGLAIGAVLVMTRHPEVTQAAPKAPTVTPVGISHSPLVTTKLLPEGTLYEKLVREAMNSPTEAVRLAAIEKLNRLYQEPKAKPGLMPLTLDDQQEEEYRRIRNLLKQPKESISHDIGVLLSGRLPENRGKNAFDFVTSDEFASH